MMVLIRLKGNSNICGFLKGLGQPVDSPNFISILQRKKLFPLKVQRVV